MSDIFERASKQKLRFNIRGIVGVEDLWDLSLNELDKAYGEIKRKVNEQAVDSLLVNKRSSSLDKLRLDILEYIVKTRLAEQEKAEQTIANKAKRQRLLQELQRRQDESITQLSEEELQAMIDEL